MAVFNVDWPGSGGKSCAAGRVFWVLLRGVLIGKLRAPPIASTSIDGEAVFKVSNAP